MVSQTVYYNGSEADSDLEANPSLSGKYMAVSAGASASFSINKTFHSSYQYSMFDFSQVLLEVGFENFAEEIDVNAIARHVKKLAEFNATRPDVVRKYKDFFGAFGSHVVTGATYGSQFQLNFWASNEDSSVNSNFKADIEAEFNGLTASGRFDASVKKTGQYKAFEKWMQKTCSCQGGDTIIGTKVYSDSTAEDVYRNYERWVEISQQTRGVMALQTRGLWELMAAAMDDELNNRVEDIEQAFDWIVGNPAIHQTKCTLVINSDWGEIGFLNPSAFIVQDPNSPPPPDNTTFSSIKIIWGREHFHDFKGEIRIDFLIQNDGSPVDIELSHGGDGSTGSGACWAIIGDTAERLYEADRLSLLR
ncbi:hypothetical protein ABOM_004811 [Aspergillus bombycis]|uniref:MACPF domain-containing protein n=1 Tax=Aspergillus bombycis TaxID=109264 RepID=A0A1F8A407_9EURO|nr:hypothetical protein ABOM_004811 [Aspergillus bombycis]OGM46427.1 hypothetical protein ABOM_004811 [Aspergillus bombycis]